ncbi:MAG: dimethylmenaquinone methyltransferase [Clostridia bacterium BRH_c25]|nr:MAG: dimethylmenaquinone methyltransferase [Clostridia bacterium BRH_c25]
MIEQRKQRDLDYEEYKKVGRIWGLVPRERILTIKFPRVSKEIINDFLKMQDLSTSVSDILDSLGVRGAVATSHVKPVIAGKQVVGQAVTIRSIPERKTTTQGYNDKDFIKMATRDIYYLAEEGDVLVTDFGGNLDVSNMGGQSCSVAKSCGLAGSVVNGAVRDVGTIKELDYPVWSCGTTALTGKFRMQAIEMNGPVTLKDILIMPGDLIVADDSGICAIPYELVETVYEKVKSVLNEEEKMRELIFKKKPLDELRPLYRKRYK